NESTFTPSSPVAERPLLAHSGRPQPLRAAAISYQPTSAAWNQSAVSSQRAQQLVPEPHARSVNYRTARGGARVRPGEGGGANFWVGFSKDEGALGFGL